MPYRKSSPPAKSARGANRDREERVTYGAMALIGAIPVISTVAQGQVFDTESTLGLMMAIVGVAGLVVRWRIQIPE